MIGQGRHRLHQRASHHTLMPIATAVAAVAVLAAVVWVTGLNDSDDEQPAASQAAAARLSGATADCRTARVLATQDSVAASGAVQQWRLHVDAMTDLVAGRITLAQATAFWKATRVEGKRTQAIWRQADERYREAGVRCAVPAGATKALETCHRTQVAADDQLGRAREALGMWDTHIGQMEALRTGKISPGHALHLWDMMYKHGVEGLKKYDAAYERYDALPGCPLA